MTRVWLPDPPAGSARCPTASRPTCGPAATTCRTARTRSSSSSCRLACSRKRTEDRRRCPASRRPAPVRRRGPRPAAHPRPHHALQCPGRAHRGHRRADGRHHHREPAQVLPRSRSRSATAAGSRPLSTAIAGKRVLIVGYGDIGAAVERRLAGWEVTVERVARHARDGVHPIGELPRAAGRTRTSWSSSSRSPRRPSRLVDADFLAQHEGRRAAGERRPRRDRGHRRAARGADRAAGSGPRSTSPTRSRSPTATRSGRPLGCCSPRTWAARSTRRGDRAYRRGQRAACPARGRPAAGRILSKAADIDGY